MCPGHSSRETEGLRVSSGSLGDLLGRTTALSPGPRRQASALREPQPSPAASASWQRHSRPGHSRAAWSLSLGWPGVDTRTGSKPQGAASHPHLLWEDGTDRGRLLSSPRATGVQKIGVTSRGGWEQRPLAISSATPSFYVKALCKCSSKPPSSVLPNLPHLDIEVPCPLQLTS